MVTSDLHPDQNWLELHPTAMPTAAVAVVAAACAVAAAVAAAAVAALCCLLLVQCSWASLQCTHFCGELAAAAALPAESLALVYSQAALIAQAVTDAA
eukprot:156-Heterococcus_DN1.PRE.1